jgi:hypothetical protein
MPILREEVSGKRKSYLVIPNNVYYRTDVIVSQVILVRVFKPNGSQRLVLKRAQRVQPSS